MINYTVSDMLTRLRNAIRVKKTKVTIRSTNITKKITEILKREGYIDESYEVSPPLRRSPSSIKKPQTDGALFTSPACPPSTTKPSKYRDNQQNERIEQVQNLQKELHLYLRYEGKQMVSVLTHLKTVSRPGVRFYANTAEIPQVLGGLGITILSTSKGILTDAEARSLGVGGEVLCMIW
jgi:small subunit ribosomal protein S8